mmetsp:Transcript_9711/g.20675  ORF Transcript_9711/g.20675 Transcript_9711/m.20675 type:complete len:98 (+) Transcript_9711:67-360(+)
MIRKIVCMPSNEVSCGRTQAPGRQVSPTKGVGRVAYSPILVNTLARNPPANADRLGGYEKNGGVGEDPACHGRAEAIRSAAPGGAMSTSPVSNKGDN